MLGNSNVFATIAVSDIEVAKEFYQNKLGLQLGETDDAGGLFFKSGSSVLYVYPSKFAGSNQATAASWSVDDIEGIVGELRDKGVMFEHYNDMPNVTLDGDIHSMPSYKAAWFKDPDGNILNIGQKT